MNAPSCPRKWQVEAARDGRLTGMDLESAARHRDACAQCADEQRQLTAIGRGLAALPELTRDRLTVQRSRQRLMAAFDQALLDPARKRAVRPAAWATALALCAGLWFLFAHRRALEDPGQVDRAIVEVHAQAGARWFRHEDPLHIFVDLEEGAASLKIRPHPRRSVVIRLPDGEVEDIGTVFDVRVNGEHTQHIAVTEGRVAVRLRGHATLNLGAGEHWDSPTEALMKSPAGPVSGATSGVPAQIIDATAPASRSRGSAFPPSDKPLPAARTAQVAASSLSQTRSASSAHSAAPSAQSTAAEDDAYLRIVALLRAGKESDARAEAKNYLLRFPNGFRRIEVLIIATRNPGGDTPEGPQPQ